MCERPCEGQCQPLYFQRVAHLLWLCRGHGVVVVGESHSDFGQVDERRVECPILGLCSLGTEFPGEHGDEGGSQLSRF